MRTCMALGWLSTIAACGSGPAPAADIHSAPPSLQSSGAERPVHVEAQSGGPASLLLHARVDGREVAAHVRVLDAAGGTEVEGAAGSPLALRAGTYRAEVTIEDAAALADRPTQASQLFIQPGKQTEIAADFPWSKVQLNVVVQGHSNQGVTVKLIRDGAVVAEMKSGAKPELVSPGKYEADVLLHGTTIRVKGLLFPENGAQTVPVHVQY